MNHRGEPAVRAAAPSATRCRVSGRKPIAVESWRRVSSSRTGRPARRRAAIAASVTCGQVRSAEPKAPPTNGLITRTFVRGDAEAAGDLVPLIADPLGLAPQCQPLALPVRDGGVRLHRVVLLAGLHVGCIDANRRGSEGGIRIAFFGLGAASFLGGSLGSWFSERGIEADEGLGGGIVGHANQRRRIKSLRLCRCEHQRDGLTAKQNFSILQHAQLFSRDRVDRRPLGWALIRKPVGVEMREHEQHARCALSCRCVDRGDTPGRHRAVVGCRIRKAIRMKLGRIAGAARNFGRSIHTGEWCADSVHARPPVSAKARATVRRISSVL